MLEIYGHARSRAFRTLWMAEELGIPYSHDPVTPAEARSAKILALNPNGHVPVIRDGDLVLFESMAINLYLAAKYGAERSLWPASVEDQGRATQWSFWAITEVEALSLSLLRQRVQLPESERDEAAAARDEQQLHAAFRVLEGALDGRDYLLGDTFTVADLDVASVLAWLRLLKVDMAPHPRVSAWLARCLQRPVVRKAQGR